MHDFRIELSGQGRGKIFMDGKQIEDVVALSFEAGVGRINRVSLTLIADTLHFTGAAEVAEPEDAPLPPVPTA